ncbi:hypothetical protein [Avibacterium paragallinarum]|uniref:hypothetical protein n=1 Tax=Avibacterium paragallinarum TaxID=728 RepID=UPI001559BB54|nr:hypothetical protein [Avibacterium paragallinarum]
MANIQRLANIAMVAGNLPLRSKPLEPVMTEVKQPKVLCSKHRNKRTKEAKNNRT